MRHTFSHSGRRSNNATVNNPVSVECSSIYYYWKTEINVGKKFHDDFLWRCKFDDNHVKWRYLLFLSILLTCIPSSIEQTKWAAKILCIHSDSVHMTSLGSRYANRNDSMHHFVHLIVMECTNGYVKHALKQNAYWTQKLSSKSAFRRNKDSTCFWHRGPTWLARMCAVDPQSWTRQKHNEMKFSRVAPQSIIALPNSACKISRTPAHDDFIVKRANINITHTFQWVDNGLVGDTLRMFVRLPQPCREARKQNFSARITTRYCCC